MVLDVELLLEVALRDVEDMVSDEDVVTVRLVLDKVRVVVLVWLSVVVKDVDVVMLTVEDDNVRLVVLVCVLVLDVSDRVLEVDVSVLLVELLLTVDDVCELDVVVLVVVVVVPQPARTPVQTLVANTSRFWLPRRAKQQMVTALGHAQANTRRRIY